MKERPILFSTPMVKAILEGRKTQTRRVLKKQPKDVDYPARYIPNEWGMYCGDYPDHGVIVHCPYGQPGDRLWVREAWSNSNMPLCLNYKASSHPLAGFKWNPSIHMPRWASRITLEITGIRVERLRDITEEDAVAEGFIGHTVHIVSGFFVDPSIGEMVWRSAYHHFKEYWQTLNAKRGYGWDMNPFVWVIEFKKGG